MDRKSVEVVLDGWARHVGPMLQDMLEKDPHSLEAITLKQLEAILVSYRTGVAARRRIALELKKEENRNG